MTLSMYQASVPVMVRMLNNLDAILGKAAAHASAKKIDPAVLLNSRLYPDMLPFARQVQIATDHAKGCAARLAGLEAPKYEDKESSFPELSARIRQTVAYLESIDPQQIEGSEARAFTVPRHDTSINFTGQPYLLNFALPNFFFHVTTAYAILRHCGVDIGKQDYIGNLA
jgi:uncharacterized protein